MKIPFRALAASALVLGLVLAPVVPASAAEAPPPLGGSSSEWRKWMIDTLGSVLKGATPDKWKREQLANANRYNQAWETLDAQYGFDSASRDWKTRPPETTAEYAMKRAELESSGGFTKPNGDKVKSSRPLGDPSRQPATKGAKFGKFVGGVVNGISVIFAAETGFQVGKAASAAMGFDVNGGLCGTTKDDFGSSMVGLVTGTDCAGYWDMLASYTPNADVSKLSRGGRCGTTNTPWPTDARKAVPNCRTWAVFASSGSNPAQTAGSIWLLDVAARPNNEWALTFQSEVSLGPAGSTSYSAANYTGWCYSSSSGGSGSGVTPVGTPALPGSSGDLFYAAAGDNRPSAFNKTYTAYARCAAGSFLVIGSTWTAPLAGFSKGTGIVFRSDIDQKVVPADMTGDPERVLRCVMTYTDGTTATKDTTPYKESARVVPPVDCPGAGDKVPSKIDVFDRMLADGTENLLYSEDVTDEYTDAAAKHPECMTGACSLDLLIKPAGGQELRSCFDHATECENWFTDSNKADKYQCRYGRQDVDLKECYVYSGVFKPERVEAGSPYADPETGEWSGGQSSATESEGLFKSEVRSPDAVRDCAGRAITGFNPVLWVMRGGQCLLEWAFIPRTAVVDVATKKTELTWQNSFPGKLAAKVTGAGSQLAALTDGSCGGVLVSYPTLGTGFSVVVKDARYLAACPGDLLAPWAAMMKAAIALALIVAGYFGVRRLANRFIGF